MQINIETVHVEDTMIYDKIKYNTNNHWIDNKKPQDYSEVMERDHTKNWIFLKDDYIRSFTIDIQKYKWLLEANEIGLQTGKFPNQFNDELDDMIKEYNMNDFEEPMFVRTENVSLKSGQHGVGPYKNLKMIIESLVTCRSTHTPFNKTGIMDYTENIKIYLFKWNEQLLNESLREFRVFVYKNNITCISQQNLYTANTLLENNPYLIEIYVKSIVEYHNMFIKNKLGYDSYSLDMSIINEYDVFFIEINCFGKEYAAGSALFHWIEDENLLYSDGSIVNFRYTVSNKIN